MDAPAKTLRTLMDTQDTRLSFLRWTRGRSVSMTMDTPANGHEGAREFTRTIASAMTIAIDRAHSSTVRTMPHR